MCASVSFVRTTPARCGSARSAAASIASIPTRVELLRSATIRPSRARSATIACRPCWKTTPSACGWRRAMGSTCSIALPESSFATAATRTIRRACATPTSWRSTRIAAECCGSARATAAPVTGILTAGCSATIAVLRSAAARPCTHLRRTTRVRCGSELQPASSRSTRVLAANGVTGATTRSLGCATSASCRCCSTVTARCGSAR